MARSASLLYLSHSHRRLSDSVRGFFFIPTGLALTTSLLILLYISSTSNLFIHPHQTDFPSKSSHDFSNIFNSVNQNVEISLQIPNQTEYDFPEALNYQLVQSPARIDVDTFKKEKNLHFAEDVVVGAKSQQSGIVQLQSNGNYTNINEVFHDKDIFIADYKEMKRSLKIYVYPHKRDDPFANALLPVDFEPQGNYASESYFKKVLMKSHFVTKDPLEADLFFLPFSIARLRHDPRVGVKGIQDFIRDYISNITRNYPYWNRTGGADHFYVACHSIGRSAMEKADKVKFNAIQVVCSSSYFLSGYVPHKDASLPQIWPRKGDPPALASSKREKLAFFAGSINSPVRQRLLAVWQNDTEISAHFGRLTTPYSDELLRSKFCLHVKGFEVNTARIGDSLYYGCVPVIIANHYDLPFTDMLNWKSFSVVVATLDIPLLKRILKNISSEEYMMLSKNVLKVRKHFMWHPVPVDYDAFYMVMYELWLRRSSVRVPLGSLVKSQR
ncbi:Exostosin, GT47 domain [Dillenia turbinata]|uniref:Exostosin, GT47 domain n=1 Tax=Dillenia turbinata TaxID=194707 RepID=A0AAN8VY23_9MAGN